MEEEGKYAKIMTGYREEEDFFRRRFTLKDYLRDLNDLISNQ